MSCDDSRDPLVIVLATVNFPHVSSYRTVYSAIRGYISFILTFMLLLAFIVKRVIRPVFPRVSSSLVHHDFFQCVFLSVYALPSVSWFHYFLFPPWKTVCGRFCQLGVRRCDSDNETARARLFFCLSLFLSCSHAAFGKHRVLCKQLRRLCRIYPNCLRKQLVRFLRIL